MLDKKNFFFSILLYLSLIIGYFNNENLNFGAYHDWIGANLNPLIDFSNNFVDTFLNYEKYGHRHSPVYLIFLSLILKTGIDVEYIRLIHLHLCLILVFLFYKCLLIKFSNIDSKLLLLLSLTIFLSPTFRSLSIWPESRIPGLIFFTLSIFYFLKFDKNHELKFAWYSTISLIVSAYISPNFSLFYIFFIYYFFKRLKFKSFSLIVLFSFAASTPMIYYIYFLDINFITAGRTPGLEGVATSLNFNISNKVLIISSIIFFHLIPILYFLIDYKKLILFCKKNLVFILISFLILAYFFNYKLSFTGGGVFFQLSQILLNNNLFFFIISFLSFLTIVYLSSLHIDNFLLIFLLILSNVQNSIYHKYYEPLFMILIFTLFKNFKFDKFFSKKIHFYILYLFSLCFIFLRLIKNHYFI